MKKVKEQKDLSKIVGLLNYGVFFGESRKKLLAELIFLIVVYFSFTVFGVTMITIEQINSPDSKAEFISGIICLILAFSSLPVICTVIVVRNEKMRNQVYLWMEDAVEVKAFAKKIGQINQLGIVPSVKLQVEFKIDGIQYIRESESLHLKKSVIKGGYYHLWSKYADKTITILYSRKYDQVMVLKLDKTK